MFYLLRYTDFNHTLIPYTDRAILEALRALGRDVVDFYFDPKADHSADFNKMRQDFERVDHLTLFDTAGRTAYHEIGNDSFHQRLSYYSDAPYGEIFPFIDRNEPGSIVTYSDLNFKEFYDDCGLKVQAHFMAHGGPNQLMSEKPIAERGLDITFIGHLRQPDPIGPFPDILKNADPRVTKILKQTSEEVLEDKQDVYKAFKKHCLEEGFHPLQIFSPDNFLKIMTKMTAWAEMHNRLRVLRAFKDHHVHIYGPVHDDIEGVTDQGHTLHGPIKGTQALDVMADSKVLLNLVSVFPGGSHERIWFGMAHGAVVLTDPSEFIEQTCQSGEHLLTLDYQDLSTSADSLSELCRQASPLQQIADQAKPVYLNNHTWQKRIETLFRRIAEK